MKSLISRIAIAVVIASFAGANALAKTKSESFSLDRNVKFSGTVLSKGVYKAKFDDQTNELTIVNDRGKVVARATATPEKRDSKATQFMLRSIGKGDDAELIGVTFGGADHDVIVSSAAARR